MKYFERGGHTYRNIFCRVKQGIQYFTHITTVPWECIQTSKLSEKRKTKMNNFCWIYVKMTATVNFLVSNDLILEGNLENEE